MKELLLPISVLVLLGLCKADVMSRTQYFSDCYEFDQLIRYSGVIGVNTCIEEKDGELHYVAYFEGEYGYGDSDNFYDVAEVAVCAGIVSKETDWPSSSCACVYDDRVIVINTSDCRTIVDSLEAGSDIDSVLEFYQARSMVFIRENTVWSSDGIVHTPW